METQTPQKPSQGKSLKPIYWIAAIAMAVSATMSVIENDWLAASGRLSIIVALVLLATARPEETRAKKMVIYALVAISLALFVARIVNR